MSRNHEAGRSTPSTSTQEAEPSRARLTGTLRLRGEHLPTRTANSTEQEPASRRRIRWAEDVIDNEGLGRKSSKVCCIFHKSRPAGESSSESDSESSSSSDESDSDADADTGGARASNGRRPALQRRRRQEQCHHEHGEDHAHPKEKGEDSCCDDNDEEPDKRNRSRPKRKYRPNAYERMPNYGIKKASEGKDDEP